MDSIELALDHEHLLYGNGYAKSSLNENTSVSFTWYGLARWSCKSSIFRKVRSLFIFLEQVLLNLRVELVSYALERLPACIGNSFHRLDDSERNGTNDSSS